MKIEPFDVGGVAHARIHIDTYPDLLTVRAIPDWRMVGPRTAETRWDLLADAGIVESTAATVDAEPSGFLFDYQKWATGMAFAKERFALFLDTGLAKQEEDERHICPLQLGLIERCVRIWSNRDETVFDPFAGMGSTGWEALAHGRRFYGTELKDGYYDTACRLLGERAGEIAGLLSLFDAAAVVGQMARGRVGMFLDETPTLPVSRPGPFHSFGSRLDEVVG